MKKNKWKRSCQNRKKNYFIYFEWRYNGIIKIIKSLEDSNVLTDGITETVKYEIEKQEYGFLPALLTLLAASLGQPVISSVVKVISGRGVSRGGKGYMLNKDTWKI